MQLRQKSPDDWSKDGKSTSTPNGYEVGCMGSWSYFIEFLINIEWMASPTTYAQFGWNRKTFQGVGINSKEVELSESWIHFHFHFHWTAM
jgi:hypothetical protein